MQNIRCDFSELQEGPYSVFLWLNDSYLSKEAQIRWALEDIFFFTFLHENGQYNIDNGFISDRVGACWYVSIKEEVV